MFKITTEKIKRNYLHKTKKFTKIKQKLFTVR